MSSKKNKKTDVELINHIVKELKKFPFSKAIILFGSFGKGKATGISDIDICEIDDVKFPKKERRAIYRYSSNKVNLSLFSDLPLYVQYEVFKGKPLFIRDRNFFNTVKERTVLEYLNKKWLWEKYFKARKWSIQAK